MPQQPDFSEKNQIGENLPDPRYPRSIYLETLFVLALAGVVRLTSLNVFRAIDEEDRWAWATDFYRALLAGDLPATLVGDGYPGIFPAWLETVWLFLASLYRSVLQGRWIGDDGVFLLIHQWSRTDFLGMQRLPVALANTALVVIIFLYCRKLFGRWIALLSAIFISLDPFLLSDSRVNRAEGLLTGLMFVALLALIHSLREGERGRAANRPLLLSALFGGLAMLTKSQAVVLLPMFGVISLLWIWRAGGPRRFVRWLSVMVIWTAAAVAVFVVLWPAAWTVPADTFNLVTGFATRKVGAEGVKLFFLGRTVLDEDPGLIFYPLIFLLRATPAMLIGLLIGLWQGVAHLRLAIDDLQTNKPEALSSKLKILLDDAGMWVLLAYALMYTAGMSLGSHKQDRFLMAAFPALNVLAAQAYVWLAARRGWSNRARWSGAAALLALSLLTALPYHPYYFSYFNPLAGGGPVASRLVRIGWGEGMDQVSAYLNQQPHPEEQVVATRFWRFMMHYPGEPINLDNDGEWVRADKIIFYIQQYQRMLDPSPGVIRYFQQHVPPEKIITINGIDYAQIYPNPIQYPAHPPDDQLNNQFRLLGYRWNDGAVTLIWENLANPPGVEVRLWAAEG
ncbi:MAG: phospholipid carrier-dependent glycosyltransferase, partial [Chloroflexi bacterium]